MTDAHFTRTFMMTGTPPDDGEGDADIAVKTKPKTKRPPLYKVLLLNDDYTPMEFVVHVLERFFGMTHAQAFEVMLTVHKKGVAVVGVFQPRDRGNQGGPGDGFRPPSPAPPTVHDGEGIGARALPSHVHRSSFLRPRLRRPFPA